MAKKKPLTKKKLKKAEKPSVTPTTPEKKVVTISKAKGRPMLSWVGKRPLGNVISFPAQKIEVFSAPVSSDIFQPESHEKWPESFPQAGLLFHGDNKEVLAHLLATGFRDTVNLIYIDPPYASEADYVRKVELRGAKGTAKLDGENYSLGEQIQYTDIWANDNYLQFMYERLLLLKELLKANGTIYVHADWHRVHLLRCLLDEVFGPKNFRNEIHWYYYNKMHDSRKTIFPRATDTLLTYGKTDEVTFNPLEAPRSDVVKQLRRVKVNGVMVNLKDESGKLLYQERDVRTVDNVWPIPLIPPADKHQKTDYPTQKPEALLDMLILASSNPGDIVLDCFLGSGTTAAVAQLRGRRWIGCDINKGAIQTTSKRLQSIVMEQAEDLQLKSRQGELIDYKKKVPPPCQLSFAVYRINDYDLQIQHNEAVNLACEHIGIQRTNKDSFFDGQFGKKLAKIVPFGHPISPLDLEEVKRELKARPGEDRDIVVVGLGKELGIEVWLADWNRLRRQGDVPNKIDVIELRTDPKYGKFFKHEPAQAKVKISRRSDGIQVQIENFISPSIIERLSQQNGVIQAKITDWRSMVDCVMIDTNYKGEVFNVTLSDVPKLKTDLVLGEYMFPAPRGKTNVAIKIIDMLGEEVLESREV